jgi:hypothetical protein
MHPVRASSKATSAETIRPSPASTTALIVVKKIPPRLVRRAWLERHRTKRTQFRYLGRSHNLGETNRGHRRNALAITGPKTDLGKQRPSQNAVCHGLTAETVIVALEDADDDQAFEQAVIADYEAETAVERELVLRLASLLWRPRRATSIETGLLRVAQGSPQDLGPPQETGENQGGCAVRALFPPGSQSHGSGSEDHDALPTCDVELDVARRFLRLADIDNGAFGRLQDRLGEDRPFQRQYLCRPAGVGIFHSGSNWLCWGGKPPAARICRILIKL